MDEETTKERSSSMVLGLETALGGELRQEIMKTMTT